MSSSFPIMIFSNCLSWMFVHKSLAPSHRTLLQRLQTLSLAILVLLIVTEVEVFLLILLAGLKLLLCLLRVLLSVKDSYLLSMWHLGFPILNLQHVPHVDLYLVELYLWMIIMPKTHRTPHSLRCKYANLSDHNTSSLSLIIMPNEDTSYHHLVELCSKIIRTNT
jgi:hypothetical protein